MLVKVMFTFVHAKNYPLHSQRCDFLKVCSGVAVLMNLTCDVGKIKLACGSPLSTEVWNENPKRKASINDFVLYNTRKKS
jgi:hypothetical protein